MEEKVRQSVLELGSMFKVDMPEKLVDSLVTLVKSEANSQTGRINAVISAAEEVMSRPNADKDITLIAKETAYDHIKEIMNERTVKPI